MCNINIKKVIHLSKLYISHFYPNKTVDIKDIKQLVDLIVVRDTIALKENKLYKDKDIFNLVTNIVMASDNNISISGILNMRCNYIYNNGEWSLISKVGGVVDDKFIQHIISKYNIKKYKIDIKYKFINKVVKNQPYEIKIEYGNKRLVYYFDYSKCKIKGSDMSVIDIDNIARLCKSHLCNTYDKSKATLKDLRCLIECIIMEDYREVYKTRLYNLSRNEYNDSIKFICTYINNDSEIKKKF